MVLILGLGSYPKGSGTAAAVYFAKRSAKTGESVVVTDLRTEDQLHEPTLRKLRKYKHVKFVFGKHRKGDIKKARLIVRNPGVPETSPYVRYARELGKPITNDVAIFLEELQSKTIAESVRVIGITGTRGKSTTTSLVYEITKAAYGEKNVHLGGNIGVSPLFFLSKIQKNDIVVLELSSWLLHDLEQPMLNVAVVTNIMKDHLSFYGSMKPYIADKQRIFGGQTREDVSIVNANDPVTQRMLTQAQKQGVNSAKVIAFDAVRVPGLKLKGKHNEANVAAALTVAKALGINTSIAKKAVKQFAGVPNRLEHIASYNGRDFYNDTTATSPDATVAALKAFDKKVILIAGGNSKQLPLTQMTKLLPKHTKELILLEGNANAALKRAKKPLAEVDTVAKAVQLAWEASKKGDVILLSPGLSWLPKMNEFERGKQFVKAVKKITKK